MTPFQVYTWLMLDDIKTGLGMITIMGFFTLVVAGGFVSGGLIFDYNKPAKRVLPWYFAGVVLVALWGLTYILTPSTKQMAAILVVPKVLDSTVVQQDIPELYDMAIDTLKSKLSMKPDSAGEIKDDN